LEVLIRLEMRAVLLISSLCIFVGNAAEEKHWAYLPPVAPEVPAAAAGNTIDVLLDAAWRKAGVKPAELAPPQQWLERAAYTLTGLPPSEAQLARISAQPDEATWKSLVDELLASPAYGERWARHWMDVARYADTRGYNFDQDNRYPFAYTYRDWLIRAFNDDLPYADFIKLQLAADCIVKTPDAPDLAALGFLTTGPRAGGLETIDDRVDVVTRGFLSSTVACARCHDHKFDPITTKDYYSLYSIFENTDEPGEMPVIGKPADESAYQAFLVAAAELEKADLAARQEIVNQVRTPATGAIYLELAWQAQKKNWDVGKATGPAFKRGRYRPAGVIFWRDFLKDKAWGDKAVPRLAEWAGAMESADEAGRAALTLALANEIAAATDGSDLKKLATADGCPLAFDADRIRAFFDQEDGNKDRARKGAMIKLENDHPGSPPRAMSLADKKNWSPAQVFVRGNPANRGEKFEREWLSFLGGGKFEEGVSPRLSLANKIADPANPLTARVMANRVWAWHFGNALADPGDFGMQQTDPPLRSVLDYLALYFNQHGGSVKSLHRLILTSQAFRRAADGPPANLAKDEANSLFWKWNRRRMDFEASRDRLLATAGSLDVSKTGGRSVALDSPAADNRRSVYAFVDRYALSNTFVAFDLPHPDHHAPKRVETTVPQQALFFLNGPLVLREAVKLAGNPEFRALPGDGDKLAWLYERIYQRAPTTAEAKAALGWLVAANPADYAPRLAGVWEIRHSPDSAPGEAIPFPLFADGVWKTGPDLATAPIHWLSAGPTGGHVGAGHNLILRWRASGAGEVQMRGSIHRTSKEGAALAWHLGGMADQKLPPGGEATVNAPWQKIAAGDAVDFVLRAPEGDSFGGVAWDLRIFGRETPASAAEEISDLKADFPKNDSPPPAISNGDPWADLIQMLWASNEFQFID
jgi:hypothetical protein